MSSARSTVNATPWPPPKPLNSAGSSVLTATDDGDVSPVAPPRSAAAFAVAAAPSAVRDTAAFATAGSAVRTDTTAPAAGACFADNATVVAVDALTVAAVRGLTTGNTPGRDWSTAPAAGTFTTFTESSVPGTDDDADVMARNTPGTLEVTPVPTSSDPTATTATTPSPIPGRPGPRPGPA